MKIRLSYSNGFVDNCFSLFSQTCIVGNLSKEHYKYVVLWLMAQGEKSHGFLSLIVIFLSNVRKNASSL